MDYSKCTDNIKVVELLIKRRNIELEINQLDDTALIKYELERLTEDSANEHSTTHDKALDIDLVSNCDCSALVACENCGEEKSLDGDFWKNKKKHDKLTQEEIEEDCRNIPN